MAVDENVSVHDAHVSSAALPDPSPSDPKRQGDIQVIFESPLFQKEPVSVEWHNIPFRLHPLPTKTQIFIQTWIDLVGKTDPAIGLFLQSRPGENAYLNFRFLYLAQALETYHRQEHIRCGQSQQTVVGLASGCYFLHAQNLSTRVT